MKVQSAKSLLGNKTCKRKERKPAWAGEAGCDADPTVSASLAGAPTQGWPVLSVTSGSQSSPGVP